MPHGSEVASHSHLQVTQHVAVLRLAVCTIEFLLLAK